MTDCSAILDGHLVCAVPQVAHTLRIRTCGLVNVTSEHNTQSMNDILWGIYWGIRKSWQSVKWWNNRLMIFIRFSGHAQNDVDDTTKCFFVVVAKIDWQFVAICSPVNPFITESWKRGNACVCVWAWAFKIDCCTVRYCFHCCAQLGMNEMNNSTLLAAELWWA